MAASLLLAGCATAAAPRTPEVRIAPPARAPLEAGRAGAPVDSEGLFRDALVRAERACRHTIIDTSTFAEGESETTWCFDADLHLRVIQSESDAEGQSEHGTYVFESDALRCGRESNDAQETTYCVGGEGKTVPERADGKPPPFTERSRESLLARARRAIDELEIPEPDEWESCSRQKETELEEDDPEAPAGSTRYIGVPVELCTRLGELTKRLEALAIPR